jgi:hypothetical protein
MANCTLNEERNCLLRQQTNEARTGCVNYCVAGLMSHCGAGAAWDEQKKCKYAEKSSVRNRCMHFIEAIGGHCDCVEAQKELRTALRAKENKY